MLCLVLYFTYSSVSGPTMPKISFRVILFSGIFENCHFLLYGIKSCWWLIQQTKTYASFTSIETLSLWTDTPGLDSRLGHGKQDLSGGEDLYPAGSFAPWVVHVLNLCPLCVTTMLLPSYPNCINKLTQINQKNIRLNLTLPFHFYYILLNV